MLFPTIGTSFIPRNANAQSSPRSYVVLVKGILILGYELSHQEYIEASTAAAQSIVSGGGTLTKYFTNLAVKSYETMGTNLLKAVDDAPQTLKDRYGSQLNEVKVLEKLVNPLFLANSLATYISTGEAPNLPKVNSLSKFGLKFGVLSYTRHEKFAGKEIPTPNTHQPYILVTLPELVIEADAIVANSTRQYDEVFTASQAIQKVTDLSLTAPESVSNTFAAIATSPKTGLVGYSWGYNTNETAERAAKEACKSEDCQTRGWVGNQFLAIVYDEDYKIYLGSNPLSASASNEALAICRKYAQDPSSCTVTKIVHSKEGITVENPLPKFRTGSLHPEWPYTTFTYQSRRRNREGKETVELLMDSRGEPIGRHKTADGAVYDYRVYIGEKDYIIMKSNISQNDKYYIKLNLDGSSQWTAGEDMYKNGWMRWADDGTWSGTRGSQAKTCFSVDSRQGWQHFNLGGSFTKVASISGGWSVDTRSYSPVGAVGHTGRDAELLTPYNQYKFDQRFPFGALLMGSGNGTLYIQDSNSLSSAPFSAVDMRINDADNALGDNGGSLQVCFGK